MSALARAAARPLAGSISDADALDLSDLAIGADSDAALDELCSAASAARDAAWGARITYSPKVFLPLTNLCRNYCDYCEFRRSPGQPGAWTMSPDEVERFLVDAREAGCIEALFCLGDTPETAFPAYRARLDELGQASTVEYLYSSGARALELGLLPHTNAGILDEREMARLREVNVSLGLMLENISPRLCEPGGPHHKAPDKRPERRVAMIEGAGRLKIPFTTGILLGIGETPRERVESLLAIRALHRRHGHIQEVIVQNFRAHERTRMSKAREPGDREVVHAVALARLILDGEVSVQAPPNLNPGHARALLGAGINDFGGISPLTPDFINKRWAWPHINGLAAECASAGFTLAPRLPIYPRYLDEPGWLDERLREPCKNLLPLGEGRVRAGEDSLTLSSPMGRGFTVDDRGSDKCNR